MKLKSYIFRWVTLTTLLPATALGLFATYYVQNLYLEDAAEDIQRSLENISAEITRSLMADQNLILKLPESRAMQQFFPVLEAARSGERHQDYDSKIHVLSQFLQQYQSVISLFDTFRIMDIRGNTLLKVRAGQESITRYEGFDAYEIMDKEVFQSEHIKLLTDLPLKSVSFIELPQTREEMGEENNIVIPDGVVPLTYKGRKVGHLAVTIRGSHIDQLLELAARLYSGKLLIAEIDEENKVRNGQILYDDKKLLRFEHLKSTVEKIQNLDNGLIWDAFLEKPFGFVANVSEKKHYYYIEYFPYPDSLTSWIILSEVQDKAFTSPFERIRTGIWVLAIIAAFSSLFLAHFAARAISTPIMHLAENLKTYADGKKIFSIKSIIDEIQESSESFTYMAHKLEQEQQERIKAEDMMVQSAKLASLGQMAAGIGHEINNPMNNIRSLSRLIRREIEKTLSTENMPDKRLEGMLEDIKSLDEEVLRASEIVQGVLSFARQIPGREYKRIDIYELLKIIEGLVKQEARRAGVELTGIDAIQASEPVMLMGDQGKLQQALVNILLNAIQASSSRAHAEGAEKVPGKPVELSLAVSDQKMILSIRDYGRGIDESVKDQIFDPFFTTKEVGQGTGLGLSIALGIIQNHKGQLSIENAEGGGAIVKIVLPICV